MVVVKNQVYEPRDWIHPNLVLNHFALLETIVVFDKGSILVGPKISIEVEQTTFAVNQIRVMVKVV